MAAARPSYLVQQQHCSKPWAIGNSATPARLRHPHRATASSTSKPTASDTIYEALLDWADTGDASLRPVAVQQHPKYGRCLVASQDIPNGTVLLSVPLEKVFQSQAHDDLELHWAAEMALRLLQAWHASRQHRSSSSASNSHSRADINSSSSSSSPAFWGPWVDALPQQVVTPVEFTTEEVQQLVIPSTVQAVLGARESLEGCFEVLQPQLADMGCDWQDFLWAVQVLHSRCFYDATAGRHMAVPGVDMANHSYQPNATVRLVHSPAACQGLDALEEVAPVAAAAVCPSYFQLVADTSVRNLGPQSRTTSSDALRLLLRPDAMQAGEQVTISYGPWPSEPLLLLFGFVPQHSPHESLVVFSDLQHMAGCFLELLQQQCSSHPAASAAAAGSNSNSSSGGRVGNTGGSRGAEQGVGSIAGAAVAAMAADPLFAQLMEQQLQAAEAARHAAAGAGSGGQDDAEQQQQQQQPQPPGFRDLTVYASLAADARMAAAQELLQQAVAAAVGMWQNQSSEALQQPRGQEALQALVPAVLPYRLQQLAQQLEASAAAAAAAAATAVASASTRGSGEQLEGEDGWISYRTAEAHRDLIKAYCSSKAQLARQLLASM